MPIVSNTSPILGLAAIYRLELLQQQFGTVRIPPAVFSELKTQTGFRGVTEIVQALQDGWLLQVDLNDASLAQALAMDLDHGEAEAIALAIQLGSSGVLIDEADGRARARALGLNPIGVLGVLLRAKQTGQIHSIRQVMQDLQQEVGFFIRDDLFLAILKQAGE